MAITWTASDVQSASAGTNGASLQHLGGWVQVPSLKPGERKVTMTARIPLSRVTAIQIEFAAAPNRETNASLKVAVSELSLTRADSTEAGKPVLKMRPLALTNTAPATALANALDGKPATTWIASLAKDQTAPGVFELLEPATGTNQVVIRIDLDLSAEEAPPAWQLRLRATDLSSDLLVPMEVLTVVQKPDGQRTDAEKKQVDDFRLARTPEHVALKQRISTIKKTTEETDLSIPITLVMSELDQPRPTHVLVRGAYNKKGDLVTAATPAHLPAFPASLPTNRLGLARWLVAPNHPLTARVTVNRLWQSVFGIGLVRTAEDFGVQGELPSHPELLDWLATEFVRTGWDVKRMMKLLVTSAVYRQDSRVTLELRALDPDNRLLARGPRYRLSAEMIRDQALAISGLLVEKLGGPSVKPYHPPGLYEQVVAGSSASTYVQDKGADLYRRSLYTYWKRSVPNPAMLAFDRPFRETCVVRRARTSTPLQALNLLNDPTYVVASRFLAQRMMREGGPSSEARIRHGFLLATGREPRPAELNVLLTGWRRMESGFRADPPSAESLLGVGETKPDPSLDPVALAAYATVASTLLNLDETITRE